MPSSGPCGIGQESPCRLGVHGRRERKTGPCFPLTVVRCRPHGRAFTLYPPGHVPYGRAQIAPVAPGGSLVVDDGGAPAWESTAFQAAKDASEGVAWSRDDGSDDYTGGGSERWWSTQCRRLEKLTRLVGVAPALDDAVRPSIGELLVVVLLVLMDHARGIAGRPGYRRRGRAVVAVIHELGQSQRLADRLTAAGWIAGLWPQPFRWDAEAGRLQAVYPQLGQRGPPCGGAAKPAP